MKSLQLSILACIVIIVACAIAFTALKTASHVWYSTFYTFTTILLLSAVIAARFRRGNEKAFWFGFAVFGWCFFVLGLEPWPNPLDDEGDGVGIALNRNLLTSRVILWLVPYLRAKTDDLGAIDRITTNTIGIAHLLITLGIAIGGGVLAFRIRRRRGRLVSVKSLTVLAGLAMVTTFALSNKFARQSTRNFRGLVFRHQPSLRVLSQRDRDATVYGLIWLPSFHHPVFVRIDRRGERAKLSAEVFDGKGGYDRGQIAIEETIDLGTEQLRELDRHLEQAAFWTMPTHEQLDGIVMDGDRLIVEGVKGGTYHIVERVLPNPAYTELCRHMLDLTGLKIRGAWEGYHPSDTQPEM
jgi:hypothetical protein